MENLGLTAEQFDLINRSVTLVASKIRELRRLEREAFGDVPICPACGGQQSRQQDEVK